MADPRFDWPEPYALNRHACWSCGGQGYYPNEPEKPKFMGLLPLGGHFEHEEEPEGRWMQVVYVAPDGERHRFESGLAEEDYAHDLARHYQQKLDGAQAAWSCCAVCRGTGLDPEKARSLIAAMDPDRAREEAAYEAEERAWARLEGRHDPGYVFDLTHHDDYYAY